MKDPENPDQPVAAKGTGSFAEFLHSWRYFLWLLALVLIAALLLAEENWRGEWAWDGYKKQMAEHGDRIELSAVIPPRVPDDQNFAMTPFLAPLFDFLPGTQNWPGKRVAGNMNSFATFYDAAARDLNLPKTNRFSSWLKNRTDLPAWLVAFKIAADKEAHKQPSVVRSAGGTPRFQIPTNNPAHNAFESSQTNYSAAAAAQVVLDMLSETDPIFDELQSASKLPSCRFNLDYEHEDPAAILLPHLSVVKHLCQILELRVAAKLALAQTDQAFQDVELSLYLTDGVRSEPFIISHLVRMACLSLALQPFAEGIHHWSDAQLRTFEDHFSQFDFCLDARRALKSERVWSSAIIDYVRGAPNKLDVLNGYLSGQNAGFTLGAVLLGVTPSGWFDLEKLNCCRLLDDNVLPTFDPQARRISPRASRAGEAQVSKRTSGSMSGLYFRHLFFSRFLLPSESGLAQKAGLAQTGADCASLACALELYCREFGRLPERLDELAPRFIAKIPHDVISGGPLHYRTADDGQYVLYSEGWNEVDDHGIIAKTAQRGEGEAVPSGDWVWRLP